MTRRRWPHYVGGALVVATLAGLAAPEIWVRVARDRARSCLAQARAPRGPALPDCSHLIDDFELPSDVSYTRHDATYRAEELYARIAMDRYVDAMVGSPDPERLRSASLGVARAQEVLEKGSQRISLEELGPIVGAPHLAKLAALHGDRTTLLLDPDRTGLWWVRVIVLEYALLEGDLDLAGDIAERYADWGPHDADLRTAVGAVLCMTNPRRGLEMLERVAPDRADKRYANIQRNFGEVLALQHACAARAGEGAPASPPNAGAGEADALETRLLTALRLTRSASQRESLVARAIDLLQGEGAGGVSPDAPNARAMLLAAILSGPLPEIDVAVAVNLVTPRSGEAPLGPRLLSLEELLVEPPGLGPRASPAALERAAAVLRGFEAGAKDGEQTQRLREASATLTTLAAAARARRGDAEESLRLADEAARTLGLRAREAAVSAASAAYVAGDVDAARARLQSAPEAPDAEEEPWLTVTHASLDALLRASSGDLEGAKKRAAALPSLAATAPRSQAAFDARWVALALSEIQPTAATPARLPWFGASDPLARHLDQAPLAQDQAFDVWQTALAASSEQRRAFRYELLDRRGDAPALILPFLVAAGRLLDDDASSTSVETWLDVASALDTRRLRLRSYAWARAEAARIRGDEAHARLWSERLAKLRELAEDDERQEMALFLRL